VNAEPLVESGSGRTTITAVFFDVDFTLIYPGPTFQGEGYARFCARHRGFVTLLRRGPRGLVHPG
jgi:hypothetical protein